MENKMFLKEINLFSYLFILNCIETYVLRLQSLISMMHKNIVILKCKYT